MTTTPTSGAADLPAMVSKALREAYNLGQRYWQQADSEYISQHKKAGDTRAKFLALVEETCAALAAGQATAAQTAPATKQAGEAWQARASHGQAPAQPDQPIACSYGDNGYACCEGGPCQADVHNDKLAAQQAPAGAAVGHTDGGRNMFYEGRFDGESQREQQARLRWANDMRAAFERHTGNGWFDKDWRTETGLWSSAWHACLAAQPTTTAQAADSVTAPAPPPECETEAEKRAFAFGWFKALESERMKADSVQEDAAQQPRLTVRLTAFPESNGKQNWTALLVRVDKWDGLVGNCGGISIARGELWNRVAYEAERARFLIGDRDTEPFILDYGDDIKTPEEWKGEVHGGRKPRDAARKQGGV